MRTEQTQVLGTHTDTGDLEQVCCCTQDLVHRFDAPMRGTFKAALTGIVNAEVYTPERIRHL